MLIAFHIMWSISVIIHHRTVSSIIILSYSFMHCVYRNKHKSRCEYARTYSSFGGQKKREVVKWSGLRTPDLRTLLDSDQKHSIVPTPTRDQTFNSNCRILDAPVFRSLQTNRVKGTAVVVTFAGWRPESQQLVHQLKLIARGEYNSSRFNPIINDRLNESAQCLTV